MPSQYTLIYSIESIHARKTDSKDTKMSLETRINGETTSSRIHASNVLDIVNLLEEELGPVIPVIIIQVLSNESVRLDSTVSVYHWHVHVVDEVNEFLCSGRSVVSAGFLL